MSTVSRYTSLALALGVLAAAGASAGAQEPVQIRYSTGLQASQFAVLQWAVDRFNTLNPDVHVTLESRGSYAADKLITQIIAGDAPDVVDEAQIGVDALISAGYLLDVTDFVKNSSLNFAKNYVPASNLYVRNGHVWGGLETSFQLYPLYYNPDQFQQAGLDDPNDLAAQGAWNWENFLAAGKKLTVKDAQNNVKRAGFAYFGANWEIGWLPFVMGNGGSLISADHSRVTATDPANVEALDYYVSLYRDYHVAEMYGPVKFEDQSAAMMLDGTWFMQALKPLQFKWDIAPPPTNRAKHFARLPGGAAVVLAGTKHPQEAWRFVEFMLGPEYQYHQVDTGISLPVLQPALQKFMQAPPEHIGVLQDLIANSEALLAYPGHYDVLTEIGKHLNDAVQGKTAVRTALEESLAPAQAILDKAQGR